MSKEPKELTKATTEQKKKLKQKEKHKKFLMKSFLFRFCSFRTQSRERLQFNTIIRVGNIQKLRRFVASFFT